PGDRRRGQRNWAGFPLSQFHRPGHGDGAVDYARSTQDSRRRRHFHSRRIGPLLPAAVAADALLAGCGGPASLARLRQENLRVFRPKRRFSPRQQLPVDTARQEPEWTMCELAGPGPRPDRRRTWRRNESGSAPSPGRGAGSTSDANTITVAAAPG